MNTAKFKVRYTADLGTGCAEEETVLLLDRTAPERDATNQLGLMLPESAEAQVVEVLPVGAYSPNEH